MIRNAPNVICPGILLCYNGPRRDKRLWVLVWREKALRVSLVRPDSILDATRTPKPDYGSDVGWRDRELLRLGLEPCRDPCGVMELSPSLETALRYLGLWSWSCLKPSKGALLFALALIGQFARHAGPERGRAHMDREPAVSENAHEAGDRGCRSSDARFGIDFHRRKGGRGENPSMRPSEPRLGRSGHRNESELWSNYY